MKSSLLLISGASIAAALPKVDIVVETEVFYYTVTQEVVQTVPAGKPLDVNVHLAQTSATSTTSTFVPVVTVTIDADLAPAPASTSTSVKVATPSAAAQDAAAAKPSDLASTAVYHHNIHRTNNSAPAMSWGSTYAGYAATVAASCKFAHDL